VSSFFAFINKEGRRNFPCGLPEQKRKKPRVPLIGDPRLSSSQESIKASEQESPIVRGLHRRRSKAPPEEENFSGPYALPDRTRPAFI